MNATGAILMAYGIQIRDSTGRDMLTLLTPTCIVDYITTASGSKTYTSFGRSLDVIQMGYISYYGTTPSLISVSGNTITWSGVSVEQPFMVVLK